MLKERDVESLERAENIAIQSTAFKPVGLAEPCNGRYTSAHIRATGTECSNESTPIPPKETVKCLTSCSLQTAFSSLRLDIVEQRREEEVVE